MESKIKLTLEEMRAYIGKKVHIVNCRYNLKGYGNNEFIVDEVRNGSVYAPKDWIDSPNPIFSNCFLISGLYIHPECVELVEPINIKPKQLLYPDICKKCKNPCRKSGKVIICANIKCRTNNKIKQIIRNLVKNKKFNYCGNNIVSCKTCGKEITSVLSSFVNAPPVFTNMCISGHETEHSWITGEMFYGQTYNNNNVIYKFRGAECFSPNDATKYNFDVFRKEDIE